MLETRVTSVEGTAEMGGTETEGEEEEVKTPRALVTLVATLISEADWTGTLVVEATTLETTFVVTAAEDLATEVATARELDIASEETAEVVETTAFAVLALEATPLAFARRALLGVAPGKKLVGMVGMGMLAERA